MEDVPYLIVNATFRIIDDEHLLERTKAEAEPYRNILTIDDPKRYEEFLLDWDANCSSRYDGYGRAWTHNEGPFTYLEKFDTFWFREWIANSIATRAIVGELEHYKEFGKLPSTYRHVEDYIVISHFDALHRYWD